MALDGGQLQHALAEEQPLLAIDWATLDRKEFDLPATFAGASWHQPTGGVDVEATVTATE